MSDTKNFTFNEVAEHNTKKDLYLIIHDKVYGCGSFVNEHPGGEEVLLDVAGQDGTEAFEEVGHSDEAREILDSLLVGTLKRMPGDPEPRAQPTTSSAAASSSSSGDVGVGLYTVILVGGAMAYAAYKYLQVQQPQQ